MQETLDVVVDITSPHAGLDNGIEVIVGNQNVSSLLAHISAGNAHSETNISLLESRCVVGSVTSDSDGFFHLAETGDHEVLVLRARTGHNFHVLHRFLEDLEVSNLFLAVASYEATHLYIECRAIHAASFVSQFIFREDFTEDCDSLSSDNVVTGDHTDGNTSFVDLFYSTGNLRSDNIHNAENAD